MPPRPAAVKPAFRTPALTVTVPPLRFVDPVTVTVPRPVLVRLAAVEVVIPTGRLRVPPASATFSVPPLLPTVITWLAASPMLLVPV